MRGLSKRRRHGKIISLVRLAKASFTFAGGVDYLAWKISRHSGAEIQVKAWHRRLPLLAALILLPRLLRRGFLTLGPRWPGAPDPPGVMRR